MSKNRLPGFAAEAALFLAGTYQSGPQSLDSPTGAVTPQMRRIRFTAPSWLQWYFDRLCSANGGGMSSDADGGVSCWVD